MSLPAPLPGRRFAPLFLAVVLVAVACKPGGEPLPTSARDERPDTDR